MADKLTIAIAAGGTAGHVNPALALAEELRSRGHKVEFFGQAHKLEGTLVPQAGFELFPLTVSGFDRSRPWTLVSALARMGVARAKIKSHFDKVGAPDVAVGFGAYVELPLGSYCAAHNIPVILHEQNSHPGLANRMLAKRATKVCTAFPAAHEAFVAAGCSKDQLVSTGNPVRPAVLAGSREAGRALLGAHDASKVLLVFGGSLGAKSLNETLVRLKEKLLAIDELIVVHSTGKDGFDEISASLNLRDEQKKRWQLMPYIDNMGDMLAAADLVLSRAGASTVAELAAMGLPCVLVPYPFATGDHQTKNASLLTDAGAALLVADSELSSSSFDELLCSLILDNERLGRMRAAAESLGYGRAAAKLADEVEAAAAHLVRF